MPDEKAQRMAETRESTRIAIELRTAPGLPEIEAPRKHKRNAKWNPETKTLDYLPTTQQKLMIRDLRQELHIEAPWPKTRDEAKAEIARLTRKRKNRRRKERRRHPDWKFGKGQTFWEERAEIEAANKAGLAEEYEAARARRRAA
jgi:hypothetical protein